MEKYDQHFKDDIFEFIRFHTRGANLKEIIDVRLKDTDDENGIIGEHYVVKLVRNKVLLNDFGACIPVPSTRENIDFCLVNVSKFNKWINIKQPVIWLEEKDESKI